MRGLLLGLVVAVGLALGPLGLAAEPVKLPPGTRAAEGDAHRSARSFKDTVEFYVRLLSRNGIAHEQLGPYRRRGVLVTRFVSTGRSSWQAIHVWNRAGQTFIAIVPGP